MDSNSSRPAEEARFAPFPNSWYYLCHRSEIARRPIRIELLDGESFVGFQSGSGKLAVLSGRCSHFGADLSRGSVAGDKIRCPLHGWVYDSHGKCTHIPAQREVPEFARQSSYPVGQLGGHVFYCSQAQPRFPLPFFQGKTAAQLVAARRFDLLCPMSWHMIGANGFDLQHFGNAHDRELLDEPVVDRPDPLACRISARFKVGRMSCRDRLTRIFAGNEVAMTTTSWCGNPIVVTAVFRRTTSYGLVSLLPLEANRTLARFLIFVPRSRSFVGRIFIDPVDAWIRRWFIREFLRSDIEATAGINYDRCRFIAADRVLGEYLDWLAHVRQQS